MIRHAVNHVVLEQLLEQNHSNERKLLKKITAVVARELPLGRFNAPRQSIVPV